MRASVPASSCLCALQTTAIQWAVFLVHGLPFNSERFYDSSGSLTFLAVNVYTLLQHPDRWTPSLGPVST